MKCQRRLIGYVVFIDRYRKFDIGNDLQVIVRCEHDGYTIGTNGEKQFLTIRALNEWDSKVCDIL